MSSASASPLGHGGSPPNMKVTDGALYLGVIFATYFQGMLTVQAYHYYEQYPNDSKFLKLFVALIWCLDFAHLGMLVEVPWIHLILNWGNPHIFTVNTKVLSYQLILIALPTLLCQMFYLHRLWLFSKKNLILVAICGAASITSFALDIFLAIHTTTSISAVAHDQPEIVSMFGIAAITDLVIALSLVYYLRRGMADFKSTNFVVTRIIRYAVATGLLSSVVAIFSLIANLALPKTRIFMAGHFSLGRMYTNALLANFNSRATLRSALNPSQALDINVSVTTGTTTGPMFVNSSNRRTGQSETLNEYSSGELKRGELNDA
ncbi:ANK-REP-REGION domain-containing protein [Mycena kentingensis (nom. inval.)]|nr:ANK-REP-REGION domain-containing protein [Mycena kentingensis (nom. inval.)]